MTEVQDWHPLYQELSRVVGKAAALKLHDQFGGTQLTFPKRLLAKDAEARQILTGRQQGVSITTLAHQHDYSEKSIRRILAKYKE
ncbi:Mor transcription activator family protein [Lactiplantibacillus nangangensis]|uniref:Mor transcription activator family protein n=1 Tax=Lactiplantibacillus nangangensis TaxID=2559917 RepID=A0ABW1SFM0_9LACO|nr:Mor transcription activator family protein [Lactiplantibacillus nangangensis]